MDKHTPGEWKWNDYAAVWTADDKRLIALTHPETKFPTVDLEEARANARLIAAAPDLLAAAVALRKLAHAEPHKYGNDSKLWAIVEQAAAAIAKAEVRPNA